MLLRNLYRIRPCYTVVDGHMDRMTNERSEEFIIEMMRMKKEQFKTKRNNNLPSIGLSAPSLF